MSVDGEPAVVAAISRAEPYPSCSKASHLLLASLRIDEGFMAQVGSSL